MFRPNCLPSLGVQAVKETAAPLSRCYTLHFEGVKYLENIVKYNAVSILLPAIPHYTGQCLHTGSALYRYIVYVMLLRYKIIKY
jgi:uncharacterized membrane protein